ncbi:ATP-binding protein [Orrella daihaiensis]|uniref:ATP-binding protein n=1 Tax=Orrella daihaiensis TaxID=2782176 RepID=A0ABY4AM83_9BURK|nr:ATP-binding protein [Orrella daihaiensis]UOD51387.1 ATP-binding protein [Orrella daihaiensis]
MFTRAITPRIEAALSDTPVVLLLGPRQAGKTTLVRQLARADMQYITLDDETTRLSVQDDPVGLIRSLDRAVIDEVQRVPELVLAIKKAVDEDRRPGRFLLTGSANLMTLPTVADSLAGRMETQQLLPLSQAEIRQHGDQLPFDNWVQSAFSGKVLESTDLVLGQQLADLVIKGGYPEALTRGNDDRRAQWARAYIDSILVRDVADLAQVDKLDKMPRLFEALAHTAGQMTNYAKLGGQVGLDTKTANRYVGIFEQLYLISRVPVWAVNRLNRVVKTPKLQFIDSGLLAAISEFGHEELARDKTRFGALLETFVYSELLKHVNSSSRRYRLFYYRDVTGTEVDIVIENAAAEVIGIEVKASATVRRKDLDGLRKFAAIAGDRFKLGVLLYDGDQTLPFGDGIWAAPISTLWGRGSS